MTPQASPGGRQPGVDGVAGCRVFPPGRRSPGVQGGIGCRVFPGRRSPGVPCAGYRATPNGRRSSRRFSDPIAGAWLA